jgi:hypothetical protein
LSAVEPPWRELFARGLTGRSAGLLVIWPCVLRAEKLLLKRCILRNNRFMRLAYPQGGEANRPCARLGSKETARR